jgi:hypothetical protein
MGVTLAKRLSPQLAKADPFCPICRRPAGTTEGACAETGSRLCYQLGYGRVSDLLVKATVQHREYITKLTEILGALPEGLEGDRG